MSKTTPTLLLAASFFCMANACQSDDSKILRDMMGVAVSLPASPQKILSVSTAATNTIVALGQAARLAAVDEHSAKMPGASGAAVLAKGGTVSREMVIKLGVDCAFVWWYQDELASVLARLGVPVLRIKNVRVDDLPELALFLASALDEQEQGKKMSEDLRNFLEEARNDNSPERPSVYLELRDAFKTSGKDTYANDLLELAGLRNIADARTGSFVLSPEHLIAADPDMIICLNGWTTPEQIKSRPGLASLGAVRNGRIYSLDAHIFTSGPDIRSQVNALKNLKSSKKEARQCPSTNSR